MDNQKPTTKKCKYCKSEIDIKAKVCPQCRKKLGIPVGMVILIIFIVVVVIPIIIGFNNESPDDSEVPVSEQALKTVTDVGTEKGTEDKDGAKNEEKAQKLLNEAKGKFDKADLKSAHKKLNEIKTKYPNSQTSENLDSIYIEWLGSVPSVTAETIYSEYEQNSVKADAAYKDKLVIVEGTINNIGTDILDDVYVTLDHGDKYAIDNSKFIFNNEDEVAKVAEVNKGDTIKILGKCNGATLKAPGFRDCYILK